jgi:hypothetical protein
MSRRSTIGRLALVLATIAAAATPARAQDGGGDVPPLVTRGIDVYRTAGSAAALAEWTKTWDAATDSVALERLRESLANVDESFGRFYGADVVRVAGVGPNVKRVYAVFRYDVRPLYVRFDTYRKTNEWEVINMTWNVDPARVMPLDMVQEIPVPDAPE